MITLDYLLSVHSYLENNGYCASGIRDKNLLHSAIGGQDWYDNEIDKIIHVAFSVCANHILELATNSTNKALFIERIKSCIY